MTPKRRQQELLDHPVRENIYRIVRSNPGIHFHGLRREYDTGSGPKVSQGTLWRRTGELLESGIIRSNHDGYRKRFYTRGQRARKALPELILKEIGRYYARHGKGPKKQDLMDRFGVSESVIRYNVKKVSDGVRTERDGKVKRYLPVDRLQL